MTKRVMMGVMLLLLGGTLAFGGGRVLYRAWASSRWPTVQGSVLASSVETRRSKRAVSYQPHVHYTYAVGAAHYTSEVLAFSTTATTDLSEARAELSPYPVGGTVTAHYSPEDPALACLECGRASMADGVLLLVGLALTVFGLLGLQDTWRLQRAERKRQRPGGGVGGLPAPGNARLG